ncbi:Bromodomain-containing protein [Cyberlindnera jadinii NRRL Y-1542]|uniref:Bromodomain-containing protein n=1 Tax=Cyberlindnera jadinii (strain ATCC 18201 / CBS 1600 / BCRC 20928 / JCM 3617 / NBRC 0987 / NRRL Y-1542) TaxID=983966 RepID=A0A1E4S053_CYBJN|nr:Bromodomain-containing protein [Cyberlindnera jadinii NRRL Y-1542]ODV72871.1 Bromodomain-containing protein [Cyberlindnera jadinii NRRL Y-1542]
MNSDKPQHIYQLDSFRLIVLRVLELFVHKSLDETISLTKMAQVINTNPMLLFCREQMKLTEPQVDCKKVVTIRDVILSITKIFSSSQIHIMENNDYFRLKLTREQFQDLISRVYDAYKETVLEKVKLEEVAYKKLMEEIGKIERGEMDTLLIDEIGKKEAPVVKPLTPDVDSNVTGEPTGHSSTTPLVEQDSSTTTRKRAQDDEAEKEAEKEAEQEAEKEAPRAVPNKRLQHIATPLIESISSYKYASAFLHPVNESSAPNYYSLIKKPRDLKTIKQMVKDGRIQTNLELEREILLMFANAIMYNKTGTDIYEWTKEMQPEVDKLIELFNESK